MCICQELHDLCIYRYYIVCNVKWVHCIVYVEYMFSVQCTLYTVQYTKYTPYNVRRTIYLRTIYFVQCTTYIVRTTYVVHCTKYIVRKYIVRQYNILNYYRFIDTTNNVSIRMKNILNCLYRGNCTSINVQCTLYILHWSI